MIIQTAAAGDPHLVISQREHARFAARMAQAFGNEAFSPLHPKELMEFVVEHHDRGWDDVDGHIGADEDTGLPYNLVKTPVTELIKSGARSPDFNERHHDWCGLLVSMHTYGLYNGRYGLSDKIFVNALPPEYRERVTAMLDRELDRQERLKTALAAQPDTAPLVEDMLVFHNYKLLQFFDTLALYFNMTHETARRRSEFANVPMSVGNDVTVTVARAQPGVYSLSPYPFDRDPLELYVDSAQVSPKPPGVDWVAELQAAPSVREIITLVAAS